MAETTEGVRVTSLADFKRFLALPGATVQLTRHDWVKRDGAKPGFFDPKTVKRLQGNAVQFTSGGWLYFHKASECRFEGDSVTIALDFERTGLDVVMVYQLTIAKEA